MVENTTVILLCILLTTEADPAEQFCAIYATETKRVDELALRDSNLST